MVDPARSDRSAAIPKPSTGPSEGSKPRRPNIHVMDLNRPRYHARETHRYPAGARSISLPSGSGVFSKVAERWASTG